MSITRLGYSRIVTAVIACALAPPRSASAVVGGVAETGYPEAVAVLVESTGRTSLCSGVVVGARVVLTAAHCLVGTGNPTSAVGVALGADAFASQPAPAVEWVPHPSWNGDPSQGNDVAMVLLGRPLAPTPATIARPPAALVVGNPLTLVGYGVTGPAAGGDGVKRKAVVSLSAVDATNLVLDGGATVGP